MTATHPPEPVSGALGGDLPRRRLGRYHPSGSWPGPTSREGKPQVSKVASLSGMNLRPSWQTVPYLLSRLSGGSLQVDFEGAPFLSVDATERNVEIEVEPLLDNRRELQSILHEGHLSVWRSLGFPAALARQGWRLSFRDRRRPLVDLGRGTNPLFGHVHVHLAAAGELRRFR